MEGFDRGKNEFIFISGGVRSGKSAFAEKLALHYAKQNKQTLNYLATSYVEDEEMKNRVIRHQQQRLRSEAAWQTFEIPNYFPENIRQLQIEGVVLLDCLTVLLANELFNTVVSEEELVTHSEEVTRRIIDGMMLLKEKASTLIIVSNEIHYEISDDLYVRTYQQVLGQLHQTIVQKSDQAYLVEVTFPFLMKGKNM